MSDTSIISDKTTGLKKLCDTVLSEHRLIIVSNRGPVQFRPNKNGDMEAKHSSSGVVTALDLLTQISKPTWISSAMGEGDRNIARSDTAGTIESPLQQHNMRLRYIAHPRSMYHKYFNILCNPTIWFLQHYMWNFPRNPNIDDTVHDAWHNGYAPVNEAFGNAIVEEINSDPTPAIVMIHDYHLYLAPNFIRSSREDVLIQYVNHIPWPEPRFWQLLPAYMRKAICYGLLSSNIVGFQTPYDVRNFLDTCEEFIPEASVDRSKSLIKLHDRQVSIRAYPLSINIDSIHQIANSQATKEFENRLIGQYKKQNIVRVDRAEPIRNIIRGFKAYERLLICYPELQSNVNFLAFIVPSRTHIRQYKHYLSDIQDTVNAINNKFGTADWQPIKLFLENNYIQAISGMKLYDVLLINSLADGMSLVAKEGPVVNTKHGVLILSDTIGATHQLWEGAITVSPADIEGTMEAMHYALTMDQKERERRSDTLVDTITRQDMTHWTRQQLEDIRELYT